MQTDSVNFEFQLPAGVGDMAMRIALIVFIALGIVYMFGRLLPTKLKDKGKNIIAVFALLFASLGLTIAYNPNILDMTLAAILPSQLYLYLWDTFIYFAIGCVFYVVIGWRFYSRIDSWLDKKIGKDDKRKHR